MKYSRKQVSKDSINRLHPLYSSPSNLEIDIIID